MWAEAGSGGAPGGFAVLLAAYGAPRRLEDVGPYLLDVRGGRPTPPELTDELRRRYAAIGGCSPLLDRTLDQAAALAAALGDGIPVRVGMRHWHPYIAEALAGLAADGHTRAVAVVLAPHFSRLSIGAYEQKIIEARGPVEIAMVRSWAGHPAFLDAVAEVVRDARSRFTEAERPGVPILFTAHSLPRRILEQGDPYPEELRASVREVMQRLGPARAEFAFQSAGQTGEAWLGPDAATVLARLAVERVPGVVLCPIGFVSDHLEVLYDVDIEYQRLARRLGLRLERTRSLNHHPRLIDALADLVGRAARERGWR